jgi:acyl transferase domain-containing protein
MLDNCGQSHHCAVEVGPHPALQGPAKDCILAAVDREIPYIGTLNRGKNSAVAFSDALGFLWSRFGTAAVTLGAFQQTNYPDTPTTMIRSLPTYPWTHDRGTLPNQDSSRPSTTTRCPFMTY